MKLWIFGDSFSIPISFLGEPFAVKAKIDPNIYKTNWIEEVANKLSIDELQVFAEFGVSNEWIFKEAFDQAKNFKSNDYIIVQLTNSNRHWFFPNEPSESNLHQMWTHPDWSTGKKKAVEGYLKYLHNDELDNIIYSAIIYSFMYVKQSVPNLKMLFLPAWGMAPETIGNLTSNVCDGEFDSPETQQKFYLKTGYDPRLNHMSIDNHYVLANKVINYFNKHIPVNLTDGFKSMIYTKDNI
tara:strand:+ start:286 stop:1005 length:720 start_codon:yes stop_codon:yes gene_type:complete